MHSPEVKYTFSLGDLNHLGEYPLRIEDMIGRDIRTRIQRRKTSIKFQEYWFSMSQLGVGIFARPNVR